jgi:DNA-binding XRE family transcriptional regulator
MAKDRLIEEGELAALAKRLREATGKSQSEAAKELGVARPTLIQAEDDPGRSLTKLRIRMIETYSKHRVSGPFFRLTPA